jgi:DNA-binding NtrC family response regulator
MQPRHIWVIDENVTARLATAEALQIPGLFVRSGGSSLLSEEGLDGKVDLVVVGADCPDRDGLALAEKIALRLPRVPQLLFAIQTQTLSMEALGKTGVVALLSKNVMPAALREAVLQLLGIREGKRE